MTVAYREALVVSCAALPVGRLAPAGDTSAKPAAGAPSPGFLTRYRPGSTPAEPSPISPLAPTARTTS